MNERVFLRPAVSGGSRASIANDAIISRITRNFAPPMQHATSFLRIKLGRATDEARDPHSAAVITVFPQSLADTPLAATPVIRATEFRSWKR